LENRTERGFPQRPHAPSFNELYTRNSGHSQIKSVELLADVHHSQLLHYMRLSKLPVGLLINFNVPTLKNGIARKVL
jgi:GxxExxY protein